jgi:hypothetical protein
MSCPSFRRERRTDSGKAGSNETPSSCCKLYARSCNAIFIHHLDRKSRPRIALQRPRTSGRTARRLPSPASVSRNVAASTRANSDNVAFGSHFEPFRTCVMGPKPLVFAVFGLTRESHGTILSSEARDPCRPRSRSRPGSLAIAASSPSSGRRERARERSPRKCHAARVPLRFRVVRNG